MTERYDEIAAAHYAAYRPPLHQMILRRVLSPQETFSVGLDVGCGTGYSAIALAEHCELVYGIDPSPSMLRRAAPREGVIYLQGAAERIPLPNHAVDIVTFAGSLFYADAAAAGEEIRRVSREGAIVVAYDFEILLEEVLRRFGMERSVKESDYDHRVNLSGAFGFEELLVGSDRIALDVTGAELAHLLLSDSHRLDQFAKRYHTSDVFPELLEDLQSEIEGVALEADIYHSKYRILVAA
jgi:SAM-dependent methyltransferase